MGWNFLPKNHTIISFLHYVDDYASGLNGTNSDTDVTGQYK